MPKSTLSILMPDCNKEAGRNALFHKEQIKFTHPKKTSARAHECMLPSGEFLMWGTLLRVLATIDFVNEIGHQTLIINGCTDRVAVLLHAA